MSHLDGDLLQAASNTLACPECGQPATALDHISYKCHDCGHFFFSVASSLQQKRATRALNHHLCCLYCQRWFDSSRYDAKFCSPRCRLQYHRWAKKTPQMVLADRPHDLARYELLAEISPSAADTVAHFLRQSLNQGLQVMQACITVACTSSQANNQAFQHLRETFQAA